MLHMNKRNGVWDRIYQCMLDGAKAYQMGADEHGAFCFGMAAAMHSEHVAQTSLESQAQLNRMSWLRMAIKGSVRRG